MTRSRRSLLGLLASAAIVVSACSSGTPSPSASQQPATQQPSEPTSQAPFEATSYPESGEAPCGQAEAPDAQHAAYTGEFKRIYAQDAKTVVFELCYPDVAFLSKIAFSSFAINDTAWLTDKIDPAKPDNQAIVSETNGTGPYMLDSWNRGSEIILKANPNWRGDPPKADTLIIKWSAEAAQRLLELQSGTVDGIDNVGPTDFPTVESDPSLQLKEREGLNVFYVGFNNTFAPFDNEKVRQAIAMGIDRQRIVDQFYPPGSEVATHFTPCSIPNGCEGEDWYEFNPTAAKQLLSEAGFPNGFETKIQYRNVVRSYLPDPNVVAQDIQAQLKQNLNIDAKIEVQESTTFLDNADAGKLDGIHLLGWGADYPDMTNFLDYHFGSGASDQFGKKWDDITSALQQGTTGANDAARAPAYAAANNAVKQHVP